ncbi:two-component system response regulator BtsR [Celerinatantimonas yamalensis]|uniref:Two-component system response regulator BtsR n=1 Tax=Celerinatantimonas yamalensis TaxID=559956 RepID=A0ABW9GAI3_9GAMM
MFNAILIDDEPLAREELRSLLSQDSRLQVVAEFDNAVNYLRQHEQLNIDVLFVDIHMPKLNGLELLEIINVNHSPLVVLVTADEDYALQAFENAAFDYLLKPIEESRLAKTLTRLVERLTVIHAPTRPQLSSLSLLPCYTQAQQQWVRCQRIEYAFSDLSGVHIYDGQQLLHTSLTLKTLEEQLRLIRCHRQYLIHPDAIHSITLQEGGCAQLVTFSGAHIPVSRRYLKSLRELFSLSG